MCASDAVNAYRSALTCRLALRNNKTPRSVQSNIERQVTRAFGTPVDGTFLSAQTIKEIKTMQIKTAAFTLAAALFVLSHGAVVAAPGEPTEPTPTGPKHRRARRTTSTPFTTCAAEPTPLLSPLGRRAPKSGAPLHANSGPAPRETRAGLGGPASNPPLTPQHIAQNAIIKWMNEVGVVTHWTEDVTVLTQLQSDGYSRYRAVIFLSTSRDMLWEHGTAMSPTSAVNTTTSAHLDRERQRCANTFGPAADSSEFTMRSAPSTTGSGTRDCSGRQLL